MTYLNFKLDICAANQLFSSIFQGMEHNPGLTEEQDVSHYIERDLLKHKEPPYKIIRDEIVGR